MKHDVKHIYTAATPMAAESSRDEMLDHWAKKYPAIKGQWLNSWERFIPFLDYHVEIRRIICSTNAIESLNARFRRSIRARDHFLGRTAHPQMSLPHRPLPGGARCNGDTMETRIERARHHLHRPLAGRRQLIMKTATYTLNEADPVGELVKEQPAVAAQSRQRFDLDACRLIAERNDMSRLDVRNAFSRFSELSARAVCDEHLRALIRQFVTEMSDETINRVSIDGGSDNATLSRERVTTTYTAPLKLNHV